MKLLKIYSDTSVINLLFAEDAPDFKRVTIDFLSIMSGAKSTRCMYPKW